MPRSSIYSRAMHRVYDLLIPLWMGRYIGEVLIAGLPRQLAKSAPLMICSNHVSWWDGFLIHSVVDQVRRSGHRYTIMLEKELSSYPLLRLLGCIGIEQGSPSSVRAAYRRVIKARSEHPDLTLALFPQGRIWPSFRRPLGFEPGVRLFAEALGDGHILPVGLHVAAGARTPKARAYLSVGDPVPMAEGRNRSGIEDLVTEEVDRILTFLVEHGEEAPDHWPPSGGRLPGPTQADRATYFTGELSWRAQKR